MSNAKKNQQALAFVGAAMGFAASRALGMSAFIPFLAALIALVLMSRLRKAQGKKLDARDGLGIAFFAQGAWMLLAGILMYQWSAVLPDLVLMAGLLFALAYWPRPIVFAIAIGYALISLGVMMVMAGDADFGQRNVVSALVIHGLLRALQMGCAIAAWRDVARKRNEARPVVATTGGPTTPTA